MYFSIGEHVLLITIGHVSSSAFAQSQDVAFHQIGENVARTVLYTLPTERLAQPSDHLPGQLMAGFVGHLHNTASLARRSAHFLEMQTRTNFDLLTSHVHCLTSLLKMSTSATPVAADSTQPEAPSPLFTPSDEKIVAVSPIEICPPINVQREPRPENDTIQLSRGAGPGILGLQSLGGGDGIRGAIKPPTFVSRVTQAVLLTPLHPVRFVHVLIQLGHEPIPPERRYSVIFHRYMYYWPGIIGYARAIARKDGWMELYRGIWGNLIVEVVNIVASTALSPVVNSLVGMLPLSVYPNNGDVPDNEENIQTTRAILVRGVRMFFNRLILRSSVTIIVQPFYTVAVRMIAQHVGKETIYNSVWGSLGEIYQREGMFGFYKGLVPALLGGVLATVMHVTIWVGLELAAKMINHEMGKTMIRGFVRPFLVSYIPRSYSYPFELMRAVMAANDSGLSIGMEPHVPKFQSWRDSYWYLKSHHAMYRGSVFYLPRYAYTNQP